jgi:hypothetical protein
VVVSDFFQQLLTDIHTLLLLLISEQQGTDFEEISHMLKSSISIRWHVPYERHNLPAILEMVHLRSLLTV